MSKIDEQLEERCKLAQDASSLILSLRKKVNIKVRQPLQKVLIPVLNSGMKEQLEKVEDLVKAEVNVKEIEYITGNRWVYQKEDQAQFYVRLGKKLGPKMKASVTDYWLNFSQEQISQSGKRRVTLM